MQSQCQDYSKCSAHKLWTWFTSVMSKLNNKKSELDTLLFEQSYTYDALTQKQDK